MRYILGLDLGVTSIGWAVTKINDEDEPIGLVDANSVIFKALDNEGKLQNLDRRLKRGARRTSRRKKYRIDRTKTLLLESSFLTENELKNIFKGKLENIFSVRLRGLTEQLNKYEIARLMIHYCKNRGFKSNRKTEELEIAKSLGKEVGKNESDEKKLKPIIAQNTKMIKEENLTPIEVIYKIKSEDKSILGYRNKQGNYKFGFKRDQIISEAQKILDMQEILPKEISEKYIEILSSQRDFSDGPGGDSKYKVDFRKISGICKYTKEIRAAKYSPTYEIFTMLSKLNDVRYLENNSEDKSKAKKLSKEVIQKIYDLVVNKNKELTYNLIKESIGNENVNILNIPFLDKKDYIKLRKDILGESENITDELAELFDSKIKSERMKQKLLKNNLSGYKSLKSNFKKNNISNERIEELGGLDFLDLVAEILTYARTDSKIDFYINNDERYKKLREAQDIVEAIKLFPNFSGNGNLSLSLSKKLNEVLIEGRDYEDALSSLGYYIDTTNLNWKKFPKISQIEEALNSKIINPNVKHILVILRKLYNTLLFTYGTPTKVHLELTRDLNKSFSERNKIAKMQLENKVNKELAMFELYGEHKDLFKGYGKISNDDFIRFKLWREQKGICMYSGKKIEKRNLTSAKVEIDHILPYSKSFDNSYSNKVLVLSTENQEKGNRTPYQWLKTIGKWEEFSERVKLNTNIGGRKKENLLFKGDVVNDEFLDRELHATSHASRLALNIFQRLIPVSEEDLYDENGNKKVKYIYQRNVVAFQGKMTSMLRNLYDLNKYTHNYESGNLEKNNKKFVLNELNIEKEKLIIFAQNLETGMKLSTEVKVEKDKKTNTFKTLKDETLAKELMKKYNLEKIWESFQNKVLFDLKMVDFEEINDVDYEIISILYKMISDLKEQVNKKNRENHIHHALDAFLLTIMTRSMQNKLTKYNQLIYNLKNRNEEILVDEKGEYINSKEFAENLSKEKILHIKEKSKDKEKGISFTINGKKYIFSLREPYEDFLDDIKFKIFDKRENYKLPYHVVKSKSKGPLHAETIFGESKDQVTKRISVLDLKNNLDKIFDKDGSQKEIYETLVKWSKSKDKEYPRLKNGHIIKKVKIVVDNKDKLIKLGEKRYVEMGQTIVKILVFKKAGDEGLRFAALGRYKYNLLKKRKDFDLNIYKNAVKMEKINYKNLEENGYKLLYELYPGECIELELDKGEKAECLVRGFSSGLIEISSIIGDDFDLLNKGIFDKILERYKITVSKIKSIKKVKKNILGY